MIRKGRRMRIASYVFACLAVAAIGAAALLPLVKGFDVGAPMGLPFMVLCFLAGTIAGKLRDWADDAEKRRATRHFELTGKWPDNP